MQLNGRVVEIKSASESRDNREIVTIRFSPGCILIVPNDEGFRLDDAVHAELTTKVEEVVVKQ